MSTMITDDQQRAMAELQSAFAEVIALRKQFSALRNQEDALGVQLRAAQLHLDAARAAFFRALNPELEGWFGWFEPAEELANDSKREP